ncbi:MAG: PaaI family thioesterase [Pseudomonadota bacterium]
MSEPRNDLTAMTTKAPEDPGPGELMSALPHSREIGMRLHKSADGDTLMSVPYDEKLIGDPVSGVVHGGVITALLDTACGSAVMSIRQKLVSVATLDLRIDYMRPATVGETIYAQAECYRMTRSIAFTRAVAYHDTPSDPIASAAGAFIIERPKDQETTA